MDFLGTIAITALARVQKTKKKEAHQDLPMMLACLADSRDCS